MDLKCLETAEIFQGLKKAELEKVGSVAQIKEYPEGEEVFSEGEKGKDFYVLAKGKVVIEMQVKLKSEKAQIHTVKENQVFGEFALIDGEVRSASASVVKDSSVVVIPCAGFMKMLDDNPRIGYVVMHNFNRILCSRIRKTNRDLRASLMWE